jgi:hypothetical protein
LKKDLHPEQSKEYPSQSTPTLLKINVILGGTSTGVILTRERESLENKSLQFLIFLTNDTNLSFLPQQMKRE